jgi:hypothetical protein
MFNNILEVSFPMCEQRGRVKSGAVHTFSSFWPSFHLQYLGQLPTSSALETDSFYGKRSCPLTMMYLNEHLDVNTNPDLWVLSPRYLLHLPELPGTAIGQGQEFKHTEYKAACELMIDRGL